MFFNDTELSLGTASFWEHAGKVFLVTNWHNLSGKNPVTGQHLSKTLAEPNKIVFDFFQDRDANKRGWKRVPVLGSDNRPLWKEHPTHSCRIDVACLEIDLGVDDCFPINHVVTDADVVESVGTDAYILGYPLGIGPSRFPVWKRCSIATEPALEVDELPLFLVDTASAQGMSGSPVFLHTKTPMTADGGMAIYTGGFASKFLGIYSGRLVSGEPASAQLGRVWKARVVEEIVTNGQRPSQP